MIYRKDLIEHFSWLKGSRFLDEVLDEVVVAIAPTAYGHGRDLIQNGAWATADSVVERFELEGFVAKLREERIL
jgi:hypothetical protein